MLVQISGYYVSLIILHPLVSIILNNVTPIGIIFMIGITFRYRAPKKVQQQANHK